MRLKLVVGDDREQLAYACRTARDRADIVVVCGGLGPTDDDVTRQVVAEVLGLPLEEDAAITDAVACEVRGSRIHHADAGDQSPSGDGAGGRTRHREQPRERARTVD